MIKIDYSTASNYFLHVWWVAILVILESVFVLSYFGFLTIKEVNSSVMSSYISIMPSLPNMQDQKLLMRHWHSISWWGNEDIRCCFAWNACHYLIYELLQQSNTKITQDARPKIVDTLLTFIFRTGQGAWCCCFYHYRRPIAHLWMSAASRHIDNPICEAKHCWDSVEIHFRDGAGSVRLLFLPLKAANNSIMDICNKSPLR